MCYYYVTETFLHTHTHTQKNVANIISEIQKFKK